MAKRDIVAEIQALMPPPSPTRWFERVNEDQAAVIQEIADAWTAGRLGETARTVSKAIATRLAAARGNGGTCPDGFGDR